MLLNHFVRHLCRTDNSRQGYTEQEQSLGWLIQGTIGKLVQGFVQCPSLLGNKALSHTVRVQILAVQNARTTEGLLRSLVLSHFHADSKAQRHIELLGGLVLLLLESI